jgi:hypothetical protein
MPRGGKREGAGRKRNVPNKVSAHRTKMAEATGVMPAEVMLDAMRFHYGLAQIERDKGHAADVSVLKSELSAAQAFARDAAPYYHPKLATLQSTVALTGRLTLEQLVAGSIATAAGPVAHKDDADDA